MNIRELKEILDREGGKIVIVEQEKPTLIVMSFDEYQKTPIKQEARMPRKEESSPLYNRSVGDRPVGALPERQRGGREEDLTIDDLPV
ncbi:MAG: hypothetical protein A2748_03185 [Candidatus Wildermuthbacteria bacterium RIFCSPHIGHO2_01_FULL_45_20]|uniref:Antitoxin n=1 Tax=Candidatus Wildermuthbacteria bacterium RIFCSPHIGHO2_02_FULL_45_25 TaxID=1802450 RepID=A0A1G2R4Y3_9BACT|nr:MAG: hypothetical protein A2748_03185 [Candidatus Wildermuthbacteria bacterium RIFCSPHIGHO2_01_FULL_45_20]OHA67920.1 MAG: hypothetical protein A3C04_04580 [Candidatus Wildermuthbacteria bacterium RIFCSPHIGHO2_02_FULL_45_25]